MPTKQKSYWFKAVPFLTKVTYLWLFLTFFSVSAQNNFKSDLLKKIRTFEAKKSFNERDTTYILHHCDLAKEYRYFNSDSLHFFASRALTLSELTQFEKGKMLALGSMGDYYSNSGNTKQSITYYNDALALAQKRKDIKTVTLIMNSLALEHQYASRFSKALNLYLKAIDISTEYKDDNMLSILNENVANLYIEQNDFTHALTFYEKVKQINKRLDNDLISAETMSNIASLYADLGKFEHAMFNVNQSIAIFEKNNISDWLSFAYGVKGKIYLKQNKFKWALYWYDQASQLDKTIDDPRNSIEIFDGFSKAYLAVEEDSLAEIYASKCFNVSKKIAALEGQKNSSETLYKIYKNQGDFEQAVTFLEIHQQLSDSLSQDDLTNGINLLKTEMQYEKQKAEIIAKNEEELAKQRNYIYAAIIVFIILLGTSIPLYFNQKKLVRLYKELKVNTKILEEREEELRRIDKTKNQLFSIIGHDLRGPIGGLQGLLRLFANNDIPTNEFVKYVPKLKTDVDHILFSLNNLLSWGQSQLKNDITQPAIIPLKNQVEDSIKLLAENAKAKKIKLTNLVPENAYVWVDSNQLDIIIRNLISNAIKFTPNNGNISVSACCSDTGWEIQVKDSGVGMTDDIRESIFNTDTNVTTFGTNNEKGTGLGLSLCKQMVERNNGKIWVESKINHGTAFFFTLQKVKKEKLKKAS
ncbi:hypothetical protein GCM10011414_11540 [Croceivirga lutea]|uniref:tetratricopeptide repeat-containing sensor histidine kinase n=1 Tax=Croceivirga lutea TaxID=1775167 RepID=UPI00163B45A4|nr:tetratricopeptide repeat-containing sensor histidine kinase [Croceivirga lutea]GGG43596.1 hypothetical protein GCM10011414_11540 [Croceivirga lutea]